MSYEKIKCPACKKEALKDHSNSFYCKHCKYLKLTGLYGEIVFEGKWGSPEHKAWNERQKAKTNAAADRLESAHVHLSGMIARMAKEGRL